MLDHGLPEFLETSVGGHFKRRDPTVPIDQLAAGWVAQAETLHIGSSVDLRRRLHECAGRASARAG